MNLKPTVCEPYAISSHLPDVINLSFRLPYICNLDTHIDLDSISIAAQLYTQILYLFVFILLPFHISIANWRR